jgi:hypothetical protein
MTHSRLERRFILARPLGNGAVEALGRISGVTKQIDDISHTVGGNVEEQTATTNEIARNVAEAARGGSRVAENITAVAEAARSTASGAIRTQAAAGGSSDGSNGLIRDVASAHAPSVGAHAAKAKRPPARTAADTEP